MTDHAAPNRSTVEVEYDGMSERGVREPSSASSPTALFLLVGAGIVALLARFGPGMADPHQLGHDQPLRGIGYALLVIVWSSVAFVEWFRGHRRTGAELLAVATVTALGTLLVAREPLAYTLGSMIVTAGAPLVVYILLRYPDVPLPRFSDRWPIVLAAFGTSTTVPIHLFYSPHLYGCPDCPSDLNALFWRDSRGAVVASLAAGGAAILLSLAGLAWISVRRYKQAGPVARRIVGPMTAAALTFVLGTIIFLLDQDAEVDALGPMHADAGAGGIAFLVAASVVPLALLVVRGRERSLVGQLRHLAEPLEGAAFETALRRLVGDPDLRVGVAMPDGRLRGVDGEVLSLPGPDSTLAVTSLGKGVGVLIHHAALMRERSLLEPLVVVAGLAIRNQVLAEEVATRLEEVRASRARLIEVSDAARRQVERDLHDGAQQRLVTVALRLRTLRDDLGAGCTGDRDAEPIAAELDDISDELQAGLRELRELARGMYPTALSGGLVPAVAALVERDRTPVDHHLQLTRRLPAAVELTAYFVIAECLANVAKHVGGSAHIDVVDRGDRIGIVISDEGPGGADPQGGGLAGLADRVEAMGGALRITSPLGQGTTITAELPVDPPE